MAFLLLLLLASTASALPNTTNATYTCGVCGHVYNPANDGAGVPFEQLPDSWTCPVCGAPKSAYKPTTDSNGNIVWREEHDHHDEFMVFEDYVNHYKKVYASVTETSTRKQLYRDRLALVKQHNLRTDTTYTRGINHLSDRTDEELTQIKGLDRALHRHQMNQRKPQQQQQQQPKTPLPKSLDWRDSNIITPVKNQGKCGSCWTFASAETVESHWALKTGKLQELSEQFILDCTPNTHQCGGTGGCGGGTAELAYARLKVLGGIPSEWEYPYVSILGNASTCHGLPLAPEQAHAGAVAAAANVTGFHATATNSYDDMIANLALKGPLAISVDAGSWHDYSGGIFDGGNHTHPDLDHLVQLVGYGTTDTGDDYWLVRNSWTPLWGEGGYIRLKRVDPSKNNGQGAACGVDITPLDGNGCQDGPPSVTVCGQSGVLYDGVYPFV